MPIALGFSDVLAQTIHEQYAIGQAGKRIIMCKLEYLRFGILAITDIGMDADHAQRLAGFIRFHQLAAAQRPFPAAILAAQAKFRSIDFGFAFQIGPRILHSLRQVIRMHEHSAFSGSPTYISRSEEHTSELQSLMRISYAVFC